MDYREIPSIEQRIKALGSYIVENEATVRQTAKAFNCSKALVYNQVTVNLKKYDYALYLDVKNVLAKNKSVRHIRGGMANKRRYEIIAEMKRKCCE